MNNWILRTFRKSKTIKALIYGVDKRIRVYYTIPQNNTLTIGNQTYIINEKDFFMDAKGFPTYTYRIDSTEPLDPFNTKKSVFTPDYYNTAINNHVARDIFDATEKGLDGSMLGIILGVATLGGLALVWFTTNEGLTNLVNQINEIREILRTIGGV